MIPGDKAYAALICEICVPPLEQYAESITEARKVHNMDKEPEKPCGKAGQLDLPAQQVRDSLGPPDRRKIPFIQIIKRNPRLLCDRRDNVLCGDPPGLHGHWGNARGWLAIALDG